MRFAGSSACLVFLSHGASFVFRVPQSCCRDRGRSGRNRLLLCALSTASEFSPATRCGFVFSLWILALCCRFQHRMQKAAEIASSEESSVSSLQVIPSILHSFFFFLIFFKGYSFLHAFPLMFMQGPV